MDYIFSEGNLVICGDAFSEEVVQHVDAQFKSFPLIILDCPYGGIVKEKWDHSSVEDYVKWFGHCAEVASDNSTIAVWGGIGKVRDRPFLQFASILEHRFPDWTIKNWITWSKKRAYGVQDNYLFTREECLIVTKGKPTFNIPLLEEKRGYPGYNKDYPAKSAFLRRTNVWTDVTELFRGKIHRTQKPDRLYEILVSTHTNVGDAVYDPCAGSLTTARACKALDRKYCVIEKEMKYISAAGVIMSHHSETRTPC